MLLHKERKVMSWRAGCALWMTGWCSGSLASFFLIKFSCLKRKKISLSVYGIKSLILYQDPSKSLVPDPIRWTRSDRNPYTEFSIRTFLAFGENFMQLKKEIAENVRFFQKNFNKLFKFLKITTPLPLMREENHLWTSIAVNRRKKNCLIFQPV